MGQRVSCIDLYKSLRVVAAVKEEEKTPKDEDNEWETVSIFEEQGQSLQELMEELIRVVIKD